MNFIIYDLEATCWLGAPPNDVNEIIEIGAIRLNGYGEQLGSFKRFVQPFVNKKLSPFCKELTGIQQTQVSSAKLFPQVIEDFWDWGEMDTEDYTLISWGNQDQVLLRNDCTLHQMDTTWLDPHLNLKKAYKELKNLKKSPGLVNTLDSEEIDFEGRQHRAFDDAFNTAKIYVRYLDEWPH